jgi:glycosyltransferase involved in cell wall biosynthesis
MGVTVNQPIKSLQIGISWSTGGAGGSGRVFADLDKHLPRHGVNIVGGVSAPADVGVLTQRRIHAFAPAHASLPLRLFGARRVLRQMLYADGIDLVASHFALFTLPILTNLKDRPFVMHFHGPWAAESVQEGASSYAANVKKQLEKAVYRRADLVIVLSKAFGDIAVSDYGVAPDKIRIVPGAVDLERFCIEATKTEARQALGWPAEKRIYISVRRLVSRMGLDRLISAMKPVVEAYPRTVLYIAGKGRLREELETQVESLGLQEQVKFMGFVADDQLPLIYRAADLNIVPTLALEGFGLVAAEALAAGTPSMVTPVGGLPEVVASLSPALILRSTQVDAICDALLRLESGGLALPSAEKCVEFAKKNFHMDRMAHEVANVYREACDRFGRIPKAYHARSGLSDFGR